jgi:hypothetical protein
MQDEKIFPPPELPPKEYFEDEKWLFNNLTELTRLYPDKWVAVVDKKVIAVGENYGEARDRAKAISNRSDFPILFIEGRVYIYENRASILHRH